MRLFIGTFVSPANQAHYRQAATDLRQRLLYRLRVVPDGSIHLTYAFLGEVPPASLATVVAAVERAAAPVDPFVITFGAPRVRWAGPAPRLIEVPVVGGDGAVMRLVSGTAAALRDALPAVDVRAAKSAHATIARFTRSARRGDAGLPDDVPDRSPRQDTIDRVAVIASTLTAAGPLYEVKAEIRLRHNQQDRSRYPAGQA